MATRQEADPKQGPGARETALRLAAAAVATAIVVPLLWLVVAAFDVGVGAAMALLLESRALRILGNSVTLVIAVTAASILVAVPLAYLTVRTDLPFRRFWTVAAAMPLVVPSYIGAFAFVSAFGTRGILQRALLAPFGLGELPEIRGLHGTVLVLTLYTYPYVFLTTRASLLSLDTTLVDAARTLNQGRLGAVRRVTLPHVQPAVAAGALLVALYTLSDFGTPAIMRFNVFTRVIYTELTFGRDFAALLSLQLVGITVLILALESRVRGGGGRAAGGRKDRVRLGRWRWLAVTFPALVTGLALVVPVGVLILWLAADTTAAGHPFRLQYAINSLSVSAAAALVAAVAGLPVAYLAAAGDNRLDGLLERVSYVGYAVPGVVMGLALVFFGSRYLSAVYQTIPLLVFAYVVRFLPQAVGSTKAAFMSVDPALPEAARTLGRPPMGAFRDVTLPLVMPGVLAGASLVFLTSMKELPATLMLRPAEFTTLVTAIWRAEKAGYYGQAAIPALALLAVSGLSMMVILAQEGSTMAVSTDSTSAGGLDSGGDPDE